MSLLLPPHPAQDDSPDMDASQGHPAGLVLEGTGQVHLCLFRVSTLWWPAWGH